VITVSNGMLRTVNATATRKVTPATATSTGTWKDARALVIQIAKPQVDAVETNIIILKHSNANVAE